MAPLVLKGDIESSNNPFVLRPWWNFFWKLKLPTKVKNFGCTKDGFKLLPLLKLKNVLALIVNAFVVGFMLNKYFLLYGNILVLSLFGRNVVLLGFKA